MRHIENMNKVMMATGMMVAFGYLMEHFIAWYSGNPVRVLGVLPRAPARAPSLPIYWLMVTCNVLIPQVMWFKKARTNLGLTWIVAPCWSTWACGASGSSSSSPRSTATSVPASWGAYSPTWVDICLFTGHHRLLLHRPMLLFLKFVPAVAVTEVKELRHEMAHEAAGGGH
jgi:molybdopterin-containing oxidoreductase family membrane subunit